MPAFSARGAKVLKLNGWPLTVLGISVRVWVFLAEFCNLTSDYSSERGGMEPILPKCSLHSLGPKAISGTLNRSLNTPP